MRALKSFALAFAIAGAIPLVAAAAPSPDAYILPGDEVFPEGVSFDDQSGAFYVSSTSDGTIFRSELDDPEAEVFLPGGGDGRTTAVGLEAADGLLYIAGGDSGSMWVYDIETATLLANFTTTVTSTFVNDVAVTDVGAFFTDSRSPFLYRVFEGEDGWEFETFIDFTGTAFEYVTGFNANGIVATPDGQHLFIVQSNTGEVFRVDVATKEVVQVDLGGAMLTGGDGLVLRGRSLYVVRNSVGLIAEARLSGQLDAGTVVGETGDDSFRTPTTADIAHGRMLVVNSQFAARNGGAELELPFTVSSIPVP